MADNDWQPKPGQRVHVHGFDGVITPSDVGDGTWRVNRADDDIDAFAWVRREHMTRLPDPEPAWWPPQPGDIGTCGGGIWRTTPSGVVVLLAPDGGVTEYLTPMPYDRPVSTLLDQHPTLIARHGKPWTADA